MYEPVVQFYHLMTLQLIQKATNTITVEFILRVHVHNYEEI